MEYELYKKLTKRQLEIADCARRGFTDGQIANAFNISVYTVKTHLKNIYEKMEVSGRTELAGLSDWHEIKTCKALPEKCNQWEIRKKIKSEHAEHKADAAVHNRRKGAEILPTGVSKMSSPLKDDPSGGRSSEDNKITDLRRLRNETELKWQDYEQLRYTTKQAHKMTFSLSSTNVNSEIMDQLYDDISILTVSYQKKAPSLVIGTLMDTQDQIFGLLKGQQPPGQTRRLLLLAGITSGLLAKISHDLADPHTAMTHSRTAYLCADNADHHGMRAWVRGLQSLIAYWAGRYRESIRYARSGDERSARSTSGVWLSLNEARAWAALGNVEEARAAITRAESRRDNVSPDELDELGGVCTFSSSRQLYYIADALSWLPSEVMDAETYAAAAVKAYSDPNSADWAFGDASGSAADLAVSRLHKGEIEGASEALHPVLALPSGQRINGIIASVDHVYAALQAAPDSPMTRQLQEEIMVFKTRPLRVLKMEY